METSLTAALLAFQFSLGFILAVGTVILSKGYNPNHSFREQTAPNPSSLLYLIVFSFILIGPILATTPLAATWTPVYGASIEGVLSIHGTRLLTFLVDIFLVSIIIGKTGGWKASPFTALVFNIPAIAILLKDSAFNVTLYVVVIALAFGGFLAYSRHIGRNLNERPEDDAALWVVTILSLVLTTAIGVFTRHL